MLFERCCQPIGQVSHFANVALHHPIFSYDCALQRSFTKTGIMMAVIFSYKSENVFQSENKTIGKQSKLSLNIR